MRKGMTRGEGKENDEDTEKERKMATKKDTWKDIRLAPWWDSW
jgi:hypothetical protein